MGLARVREVADGLVRQGVSPETPQGL